LISVVDVSMIYV